MNANEPKQPGINVETPMNTNDPAPGLRKKPGTPASLKVSDSRPFASIRGFDLLLKDEVYQIVGCAIEVLNGIGHGLHEKPYENALVVEFGLRGVPFQQQPT